MPAVSLLIKPASGICNMQCDYCFYYDETQNRQQKSYGLMTTETLKNVIRKSILYAEGYYSIVFQGGEPTLCGLDFFRQVIFYVNNYNKKNIRVYYALQTNGYNISEEWCKFLCDNNFLVGLSVDGIQETHDCYRHNPEGNETYERILRTAKMFDRYHVEYNILTVLNSTTAVRIKEIYEDYKKRGWNYLQFIACIDPIGKPKGMMSYSLKPDTYGKCLTDLFDLWYEDYRKGKQPYIRDFDNYISMLSGYCPELCSSNGICGIQNVVEADGSVYPCDFYALDDFRLGNLNENSMLQIQNKRNEIGFIERSHNHTAECKECRWYNICRGGCFRNRQDSGENYFCEAYRYFFEHCYERLKKISDSIL